MNRREFVAVAFAVGLGGCSEIVDTSMGPDTDAETAEETDTAAGMRQASASLPEWRRWASTDVFEANYRILGLNIPSARRELPDDVYKQFRLRGFATLLGIPERQFESLVTFERRPTSADVVMTGAFDPDVAVASASPEVTQTDTYRGYRVIDDGIAVSDSAIVVSRDYERLVDARVDSDSYLGTNDDEWAHILSRVQDATMFWVLPIPVGGSDQSAEKSGTTLEATGTETAILTKYLSYPSESAAQTAYEKRRGEIVERIAGGDSDATLKDTRQNGKRLVFVVETETFDQF